MSQIDIEYRNIKEIEGADINPKDHDIGTLYNSINRFGFTQPLLINKATNKLLAGHGRLITLLQMQRAGDTPPDRILETDQDWQVPVYLIDIKDEAEAQAYLIADNRLTELGGWKNDELLLSLKDIVEETGSLDGVGWDLEDIDELMSTFEEEDDDTQVEEISIKVGKYKLKVSKNAYEDWALMVQSQVGKDKEDILD
ncbi:MAG: ParB N-terminal domain-containing protein, partial [Burkholderiaceae bacterium]